MCRMGVERRRRSSCALLAALVLASVWASQGGVAEARPRKLATAGALSGVGVGVSAALISAGFLFPDKNGDVNMPLVWAGLGTSTVTPSLGNWYAGDWLTVGMGIRAAAGGAAALIVLTERQEVACKSQLAMTCHQVSNTGITLLGIVGIAYIAGAAYDVKDLPDAVLRYNRKHAFQFQPVFTPIPSAQGALLGVSGTF